MSCGVYKITNQINGKCYIGQSINIQQRWKDERCGAFNSNDGEYNSLKSRAFRKYGLSNFTFEILEECEVDELNQLEALYANLYNSYAPNGYNVSICGDAGFSFHKLNPQILKCIIEDLKNTNIPEKDLAIKYEVSLDNISKINVGKRCRLPNETYPIRKRNIYPKDKRPCPICGNLMDRKATICKQCRSKQQQTVSNEQIENIFNVIYEKGFSEAGRQIGITDNAIKKRLKTMGIPHLIKDFRQWYIEKENS